MAKPDPSIRDVKEAAALAGELAAVKDKTCVLYFWAPWMPECQQIEDVLTELAKDDATGPKLAVLRVEAEAVPEVTLKYDVNMVPTCVVLKAAEEMTRILGVDAAKVTSAVRHWCDTEPLTPLDPPKRPLKVLLEAMVREAPCVAFIKGSRTAPRCGFTKQLVEILDSHKIEYSTADVLLNEEVRQGMKEFSNWPTFPQVYHNGEFIGGLDIIKEMAESGDLEKTLPRNIEYRLEQLINKSKVMVFMKGDPGAPRCGFSKQLVALLAEAGIKYETFDILTDDQVRQELKTYSKWPTYPQVYVKGDLIGGLDIIKELKESGELQATLNPE